MAISEETLEEVTYPNSYKSKISSLQPISGFRLAVEVRGFLNRPLRRQCLIQTKYLHASAMDSSEHEGSTCHLIKKNWFL
jgi:hypothetical protein